MPGAYYRREQCAMRSTSSAIGADNRLKQQSGAKLPVLSFNQDAYSDSVICFAGAPGFGGGRPQKHQFPTLRSRKTQRHESGAFVPIIMGDCGRFQKRSSPPGQKTRVCRTRKDFVVCQSDSVIFVRPLRRHHIRQEFRMK